MRTQSGSESAATAPSSEWDYCSIGEIATGLQSRRISASELLDHTIARVEALDGPDEMAEGVGYRLALPPPRHNALRDFRVFVIDTHPLMPTWRAVRSAIAGLSERLSKLGVKVGHESALLPSLADSARLYMKLLNAARSPRVSASCRRRCHHCDAKGTCN